MVAKKDTKQLMQRMTLSSQLFNLVKNDILNGHLRPGSMVSEEALADAYGVSRSPAREALAELERIGLAERSGKRDRIITVPSIKMIREKYELWWIVDVGRTYLASLASGEDDIDELQRYVDKMSEAVGKKNAGEYRDITRKFHEKIRNACPNDAVNEVADDCDIYLRWFQKLYDQYPEFSSMIVEEHRFILDAFKRRDLADLSESVRNHIVRQRDKIIDHFRSEGPEQVTLDQRSLKGGRLVSPPEA